MNIAFGIALGYLCGSLVPGYWIGKYFFRKDIRNEGSGNIGATNAFRVLGPPIGTFVLLLDVIKGVAAVLVSRQIHGMDALSGLAAILGHTFSPFLKFKGGKGVATGLGVFLCLALKPTLIALAVFVLVLLITRRVSPASCLAACALGGSMPMVSMVSKDPLLVGISEAAVLLILIRHRANIRRLFRGEEPVLF